MQGEYISGFCNHVSTEAVPGALPTGQNSPQKTPFGLYAEQISGTAFTAPRSENRRSWLYRLRPSVGHPPFQPYRGNPQLHSGPYEFPVSPNQMRWDPKSAPTTLTDFVDGLFTIAGNGNPADGSGIGIHLFYASSSMERRAFFSADGEFLIVPVEGRLRLITEFGLVDVEPQMIAVIPKGVRFRVEVVDDMARGYVCENYGTPLRLPELGPIGSNGLANPRDFEAPAARFEDSDETHELVQKFGGHLWSTAIDHSPFDVVAWHGNLAPYRYDLRRFNTINTVSYDHPDPSIFTVLTSPSDTPGTANVDFVIFPPRWMVGENTFRPPWFHRNVMSEFMGIIHGVYDAKEGGFVPGGASLHNCMNAHGPDRASYERAVAADLRAEKIENTMAFMFESRLPICPSTQAMALAELQNGYDQVWANFSKAEVIT